MKNAIEVKGLTKSYEGFSLDHVSFQIPYGSVVGFVGENGAGKSTTIKSILGVTPIEEGEIKLLEHIVTEGAEEESFKEQVGVVFDECNFPLELKIKHIGKMLQNIYRTWDDKKFEEYLTRFALPREKKIKELSKGMKMKLSIAAALSHDSRVLILDEATSGLDPVIRNEILDIFREFIEDETHAVFLSSHITSDIEKIADYIILIHKGRILFMENKDELIYRYGIVRCKHGQEARIPEDIIVGKEKNEFAVNVLINDRSRLERISSTEGEEEEAAEKEWIIDRAGIEDILLYVVHAEEKMQKEKGEERR